MKAESLLHISRMRLDKYLAVTPLSNELVRYIPSYSFSFYWTNRHHEIVHVYDSSDSWPEVAFEYHTNFCNKHDNGAHPNLIQWHRNNSGVVHSCELYFGGYYDSEDYRKIWSKLGYYHSLIASIKKNGSPVGILKLHRLMSAPPFSNADKKKLYDILPIIAECLSYEKGSGETPLVSSDVFGIIIVNHKAELQFVSPIARKLIHLCASSTAIAEKRSIKPSDIENIYARVLHLCDKLKTKYSTQYSCAVEKDYIQNCWGGFSFISNWLHPPTHENEDQFCISIHYHEPSCIKLLRSCESYSLTSRQIQICILLSQKKTFGEIAKELHLSSHTIIDHMKKVYHKLNVSSRNEVVQQLML